MCPLKTLHPSLQMQTLVSFLFLEWEVPSLQCIFLDDFMSHFSSSHDFCVTETMMEAPTLVSSVTSATLKP